MTDPSALSRVLPAGACDCHMHVFEPRFGGQSDTPAPLATAAMYRELQAEMGLQRMVVVQSNRYGTDNRGMLDAVAARVRPFGWHLQLQFDGWTLPTHAARLRALPVDIVIDHLGKFMSQPPPDVDDPAFRALLGLLDGGRCWVKLSAPYESSRLGTPGYDDVAALARALAASFTEGCVWGSNWPHPGRTPAPSPVALLDQLFDWAGDQNTARRILVDNPQRLYDFGTPTPG